MMKLFFDFKIIGKFGNFINWEVVQLVRTPGLGPGGRRFESGLPNEIMGQ